MMRFLIQKIDNKVVHDFSFTLLEAVRYQQWAQNDPKAVTVKYINSGVDDKTFYFKPHHEHYVPVGSVEFVTSWFKRFYDHTPKPINVPESLFEFGDRSIFNGTEKNIPKNGYYFVKSNDQIKRTPQLLNCDTRDGIFFPTGNYQFSEHIDIESEWRCFVYQGKLVGLQNYSGDFTMFPDVNQIQTMIKAYKSTPIAYTLDVGVKPVLEVDGSFFNKTFVVEIHDFFSCGLYKFSDHKIYPHMLYRWYHEYLNKIR